MAGKKESSSQWRQASVMIRTDILEQARQKNIDISEACNQVLAGMLEIDYLQQKIPEVANPEPVIIASNGKPALLTSKASKPGAPAVPAIINADDPQAAKRLKSWQHPKEKTCNNLQVPPPLFPDAKEKGDISHQNPSPIRGKTKKSAPPRRKKEDAAKIFFASMVIREETENGLIAKDDMYYIFERWCRDHRVSTIPDKKTFSVTLKTQYAVKEKMINGTPTWVGVRVR
jgi:hypothetical protein